MIKMSTREATQGTTDLLDLDLIDEYVAENTAREQASQPFRLPGPPPPPQDSDLPELSVTHRRRPARPEMLVSRGTAPQVPLSQPQLGVLSSSSSMTSPVSHPVRYPGSSRQARGSRAAGPAPAPAGGAAQQHQSDTRFLERFLETPVLDIVEQPKERGMRFRYECEGRSAGSILGASSTDSNKTLPGIEVKGCKPKAKEIKVTVSLVTKDIPHRPHPHSLVGKDCADGICVIRLNPCRTCRHSFSNLGIQCVRRKELEMALEKRRNQKIDPFNTGHSKSIEDIDMNVVRLCFQCEVEMENKERILLSPVVSNAIYDKKATTTSELKINRLNVDRGPCTGKTEIYLLCDKVQKDDIEIIFSLGKWEAKAEFAQTDVHRQIAIVFKSPPYQEQNIGEEVEVNVFLRRLSDHMDSEPVSFTYEPQNPDPYEVNRKRKLKSDMTFAERCSTAAQSEVLLESPPPHLFPSHSFVSSDLAQGMEEMHCPSTSHGVKQEDIFFSGLDSGDFQTLLALLPPNYGYHSAGLPATVGQDPNSNYDLLDLDFNSNMQGDGRMQGDMNFYNDVHINPRSLLEELDGPTAQPVCPCDNADPALGPPMKMESHIDL